MFCAFQLTGQPTTKSVVVEPLHAPDPLAATAIVEPSAAIGRNAGRPGATVFANVRIGSAGNIESGTRVPGATAPTGRAPSVGGMPIGGNVAAGASVGREMGGRIGDTTG